MLIFQNLNVFCGFSKLKNNGINKTYARSSEDGVKSYDLKVSWGGRPSYGYISDFWFFISGRKKFYIEI